MFKYFSRKLYVLCQNRALMIKCCLCAKRHLLSLLKLQQSFIIFFLITIYVLLILHIKYPQKQSRIQIGTVIIYERFQNQL